LTAEDAAAREALAGFGIVATRVELVSRSENITFRVEDGGGPYGLRLHRPGYQSLAELASERVWTRALAAAGLAVPVGVRAADGRDFVAAGPWLAGLTRWIVGEVPSQPDPGLFTRLGELAAGLHAHAADWKAPPGFTRRALDAEGLMGASPNWGRFWEHADLTIGERTLFETTRAALHRALSALPRDGEHFGMIHADLHDGNLLVDGDALTIIDFDDAAFGWYLYDLAVAITHHQGEPGFDGLRSALLAGYRSRRDFPDDQAALLPMFVLVRRLAVIGWLHQRPEIDAAARLAEMKPLTCKMCEAFLGGG
jgi:Ser/Thr protein kinase RdoA (MazF antagonist)